MLFFVLPDCCFFLTPCWANQYTAGCKNVHAFIVWLTASWTTSAHAYISDHIPKDQYYNNVMWAIDAFIKYYMVEFLINIHP